METGEAIRNICEMLRDKEDKESLLMAIGALRDDYYYRWHDLSDDPDDLPMVSERVVFLTKPIVRKYTAAPEETEPSEYYTGIFDNGYYNNYPTFINDDYEMYVTQGEYEVDKVYAWKRIEPFEVVTE